MNKLWNIVKDMTKEAGIEGYFSNHSLRSTAATCLYQGGMEEQVITEITGHRLLAIRGYKKTHNLQKRKASEILQSQPEKCAHSDN